MNSNTNKKNKNTKTNKNISIKRIKRMIVDNTYIQQ